MKKLRTLTALLCIAFVGACTICEETKTTLEPQRFAYANEETLINLQQPFTRVIVKCYSTKYEPAETCAKLFESKGYVRFDDIPYKTANYDFLRGGSYPTRRWRPGEITPRW